MTYFFFCQHRQFVALSIHLWYWGKGRHYYHNVNQNQSKPKQVVFINCTGAARIMNSLWASFFNSRLMLKLFLLSSNFMFFQGPTADNFQILNDSVPSSFFFTVHLHMCTLHLRYNIPPSSSSWLVFLNTLLFVRVISHQQSNGPYLSVWKACKCTLCTLRYLWCHLISHLSRSIIMQIRVRKRYIHSI